MLILCDFDGTVTTHDVTNLLWDRFGLPDWRERLLPPYRAGTITNLQIMDAGWQAVSQSREVLIAAARAEVTLRDGFLGLIDACARERWPVHVVSGGLDWYLRAFLPDGVPFTSYTARFDKGWRVTLPEGCNLDAGVDFKVQVMRERQVEHPGHETVFIGDGRNDFAAARICDRVFAIRGSTLASLCRRDGVPCEEFLSFREVEVALLGASTTAQ